MDIYDHNSQSVRHLWGILEISLKSKLRSPAFSGYFTWTHVSWSDAVDVAAAVVPPQVKCSLVLPLTIIDCIENMHCHVHPDMKTIEN